MNIKSFEVYNFKSIEYSGKIKFPKISILIGPNSSGKSSILQALLLMKQTFETEEPSIPLTLNGQFIQLGEYGDFIHGRDTSQPFIIKFNFEEAEKFPYECEVCGKSYKLKGWFLKHVKELHPTYWKSKQSYISDDKYHLPKTSSLTFQYVYNSKTKSIILKEIEIENPPSFKGLNLASFKIKRLEKRMIKIVATSINGKKIYTKSLQIPNSIENLDHETMVNLIQYLTYRASYYSFSSKIYEPISLLKKDFGDVLEFKYPEDLDMRGYYFWRIPIQIPRSLSEEQKIAVGIESGLFKISHYMASRIQDLQVFFQGIHHVGPLRNWPERLYFGTGGRPTSVGLRGEYTQELFWIDKRIGHEKLIKDINDWLVKLKLDVELEVVPLGVGDIYQLRVKENDLSINIADVGFGMSQILPILTECINYTIGDSMKENEIKNRFYNPFESETKKVNKLLITEQPEIHLNPRIQAELGDFFIHIAEPEKTLLIETHSEHIISRIQRRVVDETLNPEDVVVYFISKNGNKSDIKEISISRKGHFNYWPEGFFQDDFEDAIEILKTSLRQEENK